MLVVQSLGLTLQVCTPYLTIFARTDSTNSKICFIQMSLGAVFAAAPFHHECGQRFLVVLVLHHAHLFSSKYLENNFSKENKTFQENVLQRFEELWHAYRHRNNFTITLFLIVIYIGSYFSTLFKISSNCPLQSFFL